MSEGKALDMGLIREDSTTNKRRLTLSSIILLGAMILIGIIIGTALNRQLQTQPTSGPAPDFKLQTFDGQEFVLSEQRGKVVVINFWASWCDPCREEAPLLQEIWERYQDRGVILVGIAYADVESASLAYIEEFGLTYPHGPDFGTKISDDYFITGVPETFIVDQKGEIAYFALAPIVPGQLEPVLDELLETDNRS